jgi:Zn-dependent M28 family amino/carboxypeptidase
MVANLNFDMISRNAPDTIVAIGREHSDLGETLAEVNARHPEVGLEVIDDPWPDERYYFRSDHYNFARNGVPILFFFSGSHDDYHRPSDEVATVDAGKISRVAALGFHLALHLAEQDARPSWNPESYEQIVE